MRSKKKRDSLIKKRDSLIKKRANSQYSFKIEKLINKITKDGKKPLAEKIVKKSLKFIEKKINLLPPLDVFDEALENIKLEKIIKSLKHGSKSIRFIQKIDDIKSIKIALKWIIESAREMKWPYPMHERLATEIINAYNKEGNSFKKKEQMLKNMTK